MEYIFLLAAVAAGLHAYSFARWLLRDKNKSGAILVLFLIMLSLGVPVYRIMMSP
jgi:uncharacterized membrane protein YjdF